jgi:antitoxin (DNA-binding transcriptional repressor) of toxin-antitoxin stability system
VEQLGIREVRAGLAAAVRRASAGERVVITIDGRPVAQLGPIEAEATPSLESLAASGLLEPPRATARRGPVEPIDAPVDVRLDRVVDEVRGA